MDKSRKSNDNGNRESINIPPILDEIELLVEPVVTTPDLDVPKTIKNNDRKPPNRK